MKTDQPPSHDELMRLLGGVMENYSWEDFRPILRNPARLADFLGNLDPDQEGPLDPEDPAVGERATLTADAEQQAMLLLQELKPEDRERLKAGMVAKWGPEAAAMLPASQG